MVVVNLQQLTFFNKIWDCQHEQACAPEITRAIRKTTEAVGRKGQKQLAKNIKAAEKKIYLIFNNNLILNQIN